MTRSPRHLRRHLQYPYNPRLSPSIFSVLNSDNIIHYSVRTGRNFMSLFLNRNLPNVGHRVLASDMLQTNRQRFFFYMKHQFTHRVGTRPTARRPMRQGAVLPPRVNYSPHPRFTRPRKLNRMIVSSGTRPLRRKYLVNPNHRRRGKYVHLLPSPTTSDGTTLI